MASLKDTLIQGSARVTDTLYTTTAQLTALLVPTTSNGNTYGPGTNGQVLKSNGSSVYWSSLGSAAGYSVTDSSSASAIGTGTALVTERDVYYGLPTINNAHNYTSSTTIYAPTIGGTTNYVLMGNGTTAAPIWKVPKDALNIMINALDTGSSALTANDYVITQYVGGGTTTTTYHRRPASAMRVGGLLTARKLKVALGSTTDVTFNGTADQTSIPVSGILNIAHGGTGAATAADALLALIGSTAIGSTTQPIYWDGSKFALVNAYNTLFQAFTSSGNTLTIKIGDVQKTASIINSLSLDSTAGTASASQTLTMKVNGQSATSVSLTKGTTSVLGVVKLTNGYTSTDSTLAATGASILAAIQTLDVTAVGGSTGEYISKISETDGKISATKATTTVSLAYVDGTTAGPTVKATVNGITSAAVAFPKASDVKSGAVTTDAQTFGGAKTFKDTTTIGRNIIRNNSAPMQGDTILAFAYKNGYPVYTDPIFASGTNSVNPYNNSGGGTVVHTRMTYTDAGIDSPGTGSNYVIQIKTTGTASPGCGGFVQTIHARANAIFVQIFRALVPEGRSLSTNSNNMGNSYKDEWLTSNVGTGKWEWYARRVICGKEGTMSDGGHVSINGAAGTTEAPVIWYLGACNLYDLTKFQYDGLRTRYADSATSADKATKLATARNIQINLASTAAASFDGSANVTPGVTGTLSIENGGTGETTANDAANALISGLPIWTATPTADTYFIRRDTGGTAAFGQVKFSSIANITNGKITLGPYSITPVTSVNGHTGNSVNVTAADLGLSKAMHFIGVATVAITDGSTTDPVISGYSTKTAGDVIIDKDSSREYVWSTTGKWELLGGDSSYKTTQSAIDSGAAATNKWVSRIQQNANGVVAVTMGTLDTSGAWSGNAATTTKLQTARSLWGQSFNGTADITGNMTNVGPQMKLPSGQTTFSFLTSSGGAANANFGRLGLNSNYANIDLTNYVLDVAGTTRLNGTVYIHPTTGSYTEGIRIYPIGNWATIMLLGNDHNNALSGTSANSWGLYNNNGAFWISRNASAGSGTYAFGHNGTNWITKGHLAPHETDKYTLGVSNSLRWKALFIGTADSYGASNHPIYWNAGVPTAATVGDSYLSWGDQNHAGSSTLIETAMNSALRGQRFDGFKAAGITIEYSIDAGSTWTAYTLSDDAKRALFTQGGSINILGGQPVDSTQTYPNAQLRVTANVMQGGIYSYIARIALYISTNNSSSSKVKVEVCQNSAKDTLGSWSTLYADQPISGWSGWNSIWVNKTFGSQSGQYGAFRLTFSHASKTANTSSGLQIFKIYGYGGVGWTTQTNIAARDHIYTWDAAQNAYFPAKITASGGFADYNNGTPTKFGYSTSGLAYNGTSWLAAWDTSTSGEYRLRAINAENLRKFSFGTSAIGSTKKPIYYNGSNFVAISDTVGTANDPIYIAGGEFTQANKKLGAVSDGTYWGIRGANNEDSVWIRTTSLGFIPNQSGGVGSGHAGLGTDSWRFATGFIDTVHVHQLIVEGATNATMTSASTNPRLTFQEGTGTQPVHLIYTDIDSYRSPAGLKVVGGASATPAWFEVEGQVYAARFNGPLTGDVTGNASTATTATQLSFKNGRIASADLDISTIHSKMLLTLASSSMTTSKPPMGDGYIVTYGWDNAYWGAQQAISHTKTPHMAIRGTNGSSTNDWGDWIYLLDANNYTNYTVTKTGGGASGTWGISITGNAATASSVAWANVTGKPISFGSITYGTTGWKQLGGRATSQASIMVTKPQDTVTWGTSAHSAAITYGCEDTKGMIDISYGSPLVSIAGGNAGGSTDEAPRWYFKLSATSGQTYTFPSTSKTLTASDGSNASGTWGINITGNAGSATKLQTARTINGTSFDGTANITTAHWGTARTLTIGNKAQSVKGDADVTWSLNNILYNATTIGVDTSWDQIGPSVYYVASSSAFTGINHPGNNTEQMPYTYGQLIVSRANNGGILQVYASHTGSAGNTNSGLRYRTGWNSAGWQAWSTILDDRLWRKYIFANKNIGRSSLTVKDSTWAVTSGTDVFGLSFKDTGLTYTPSGGSATASSDAGDWRAWLTCAAESNTVVLNMRIDGTWQASKFIGPLQGNASTATALTSNAGSATQPIYFSGGKPVATTYALSAAINSGTASRFAYYTNANSIGSYTGTVGNAYTPIYFNNGVPTTVGVVQYTTWTIASGATGVTISKSAYTTNTYVISIVVTAGEPYLNGAISWTSADGSITLSTAQTSGEVTGYILTAIGTAI